VADAESHGRLLDFHICLSRTAVPPGLRSPLGKPKFGDLFFVYLVATFVLFHRGTKAARMSAASGQARNALTNRLGEHGGVGFGPMRRNAKFSRSRLIVGGIFVGLMPNSVF
jgi:hypothetical protein